MPDWDYVFARYMMVLAIVGYSWVIAQAVTIIQKGTSEGVSVFAISIYFAVSLNWLIYGLMRKDSVMVTGSSVSLLTNTFLIASIFVINSPAWKEEEQLGSS